jgi:hypothetical protein
MLGLSADQRGWIRVLALSLVVSLLTFVYLAQTGYVVRQIEEMQNLEASLLDLKRENNALRLEAAEYEQWSRLRRQARALGFAEPQRVEYVEVPVSETPAPPSERDLVDENLPSSLAPSLGLPSGWQELARKLAAWIRGEQTAVGTVGEVR